MKVVEIVDDTVYIQHHHSLTNALNKPLYDTIDWLELAKQKMALLNQISGERGSLDVHPLDGLVNLIDAIQDDAEAQGYPVVWAYDVEAWENGELDLEEENE